jgi:D-3-phosphoglycerate dehydrogenase
MRLAEELGVKVGVSVESESLDHRSTVTLRAVYPDGSAITVSGALTGRNQVHKLVEVNGRGFDLRAEKTLVIVEYADRPGVMGRVGTLLGEAGVNIEAAQISQTSDGSNAIMLLRVDRGVDASVIEPVGAAVGAELVRAVTFE